jgi:hypothetical protein
MPDEPKKDLNPKSSENPVNPPPPTPTVVPENESDEDRKKREKKDTEETIRRSETNVPEPSQEEVDAIKEGVYKERSMQPASKKDYKTR